MVSTNQIIRIGGFPALYRASIAGLVMAGRSLTQSVVWEETSSDLTGRYALQGRIGGGAYGEVFRGTHRASGARVAVKRMRSETLKDGIPATALREIVFLKQLSHENIVCLTDAVVEPGQYFLVFELMDGDLYFLLQNSHQPLAPDLVQSYTSQLLQGLAYCHSNGIMHRDLKPQNLLISRDGTLKIADFGLCRAFCLESLTIEVVTPWYRPPEILLGSKTYDLSVDIWSAGCIIAEMSSRNVLFQGNCDVDQLHLIFQLLGWRICWSFI